MIAKVDKLRLIACAQNTMEAIEKERERLREEEIKSRVRKKGWLRSEITKEQAEASIIAEEMVAKIDLNKLCTWQVMYKQQFEKCRQLKCLAEHSTEEEFLVTDEEGACLGFQYKT